VRKGKQLISMPEIKEERVFVVILSNKRALEGEQRGQSRDTPSP